MTYSPFQLKAVADAKVWLDRGDPDDAIASADYFARALLQVHAELTEIERATAERIAAWLNEQEDQDGCGEGMVAGIRAGAWKKP